jgi:pimeloyl-ACP methyl ester carboxylesterase
MPRSRATAARTGVAAHTGAVARTGAAVVAALLLFGTATPATAAAPPRHIEGTLDSGAAYVIDVPADWNGTVLLFSHGYRPAGSDNPATDAPDDATRALLLDEGYALAGSSYATTGWAAEQAVPDQLATLTAFTDQVGTAKRTLAWGESYGGLVTTAIAERHADRIDGSLSMCGLLQGGVANWNSTLDATFALKSLLAPGADLPLAGFADAAEARAAAQQLSGALDQAQTTATGRARIALAAALHRIPAWNDPAQPRPAPSDHTTAQANQYAALSGLVGNPGFAWRQEAEARADGNMSWNTGVDYGAMLRNSPTYTQVKALYKAADRSLGEDLRTLANSPRIKADSAAVRYMTRNVAFSGALRAPHLTIHTTGDGLIPVQAEQAYDRTATRAGSKPLLRQAYVDAPGHCTFSPGEQVAALHTLEERVQAGRWGNTSAEALNSASHAADPGSPARYTHHRPGPYPRPYDVADRMPH